MIKKVFIVLTILPLMANGPILAAENAKQDDYEAQIKRQIEKKIDVIYKTTASSGIDPKYFGNILTEKENGQRWYVHPYLNYRYRIDENDLRGSIRNFAHVVGDKHYSIVTGKYKKDYGKNDFDSDGDGLLDVEENDKHLKTNPKKADTDGDGFSDFIEVMEDFDPLSKTAKNRPKNNIRSSIAVSYQNYFIKNKDGELWYQGTRKDRQTPKAEKVETEADARRLMQSALKTFEADKGTVEKLIISDDLARAEYYKKNGLIRPDAQKYTHYYGNKDAKNTITLYYDLAMERILSNEPTKAYEEKLRSVVDNSKGTVKLAYVFFHVRALNGSGLELSKLAECAYDLKGDKGFDYVYKTLRTSEGLTKESMEEFDYAGLFSKKFGVKKSAVESCVKDKKNNAAKRIQQEMDASGKKGMLETVTAKYNNVEITGIPDDRELEKLAKVIFEQ